MKLLIMNFAIVLSVFAIVFGVVVLLQRKQLGASGDELKNQRNIMVAKNLNWLHKKMAIYDVLLFTITAVMDFSSNNTYYIWVGLIAIILLEINMQIIARQLAQKRILLDGNCA